MNKQLTKNAQKIQSILESKNLNLNVVELSDSCRTAQQAADSIGCTVSQIVKSLIFQTKQTEKPILVLASGTNRVNEKIIAQHVGEKIRRANPDFVRKVTGFAIGGVAPIGHTESIQTFIDKDLLQYDELWAAAGHPNAVFSLQPKHLAELTHGSIIEIQ